ncbi:hypothetical protein [Clostridium saudiense]|uniref:hypothetical protein n=1 Tax=Clostridium saudiense TaxID=1414720 RepID=UPI0018A94DFF|nr:hypothetical protein [Clostridium saudiense]
MTNKNSKFQEIYTCISSDKNIQEKLISLRGKALKVELKNLFPELSITPHAMRKVTNILTTLNTSQLEISAELDKEEPNKKPIINDVENETINDDSVVIEDVTISSEEETEEIPTVIISTEDALNSNDSTKCINELICQNTYLENQLASTTNELIDCKSKLDYLLKRKDTDIAKVFEMTTRFSKTSKSVDISESMLLSTLTVLAENKIIDVSALAKQGVNLPTYVASFAFCYLLYNLTII